MAGSMSWSTKLFGELSVALLTASSLVYLSVGVNDTSTRFRSGGSASDSLVLSFDLSFRDLSND
jgi:hypothetical protein